MTFLRSWTMTFAAVTLLPALALARPLMDPTPTPSPTPVATVPVPEPSATPAATEMPVATATPVDTTTPVATTTPVDTETPAPGPAHQVVYLRDGSVIPGQIVETRDGILILRTENGDLSIRSEKVLRVDYSPASAASEAGPVPPGSGAGASPTPPPPRDRSENLPVSAAGYDRDFYFSMNLQIGARELPARQWSPVQGQGGLGLEFSLGLNRVSLFGPDSLALALDLFATGASTTTVDAQSGDNISYSSGITEAAIGARWFLLDKGLVRPYVGAGVSSVGGTFSRTDQATNETTQSDNRPGMWLQAGGSFRLGHYFLVGAEFRQTLANVSFNGPGPNAGFQFAMHVGFCLGSARGM